MEGLGVFATIDAGLTWDPSGKGLPGYESFYDMVVGEGVMYVSGAYNGIYTSANGFDWDLNYELPASALGINGLGHVFAGYSDQIYRTTDQGSSWPLVGTISGVQQITGIA
jgi:hypothetical protein